MSRITSNMSMNVRFGLKLPWQREKVHAGPTLDELQNGKGPVKRPKRRRKFPGFDKWPYFLTLALGIGGGMGYQGLRHYWDAREVAFQQRQEEQRLQQAQQAAGRVSFPERELPSLAFPLNVQPQSGVTSEAKPVPEADKSQMLEGESATELPQHKAADVAGGQQVQFLQPRTLLQDIILAKVSEIKPYTDPRLPSGREMWWEVHYTDKSVKFYIPKTEETIFADIITTLHEKKIPPDVLSRPDYGEYKTKGEDTSHSPAWESFMAMSIMLNIFAIFGLIILGANIAEARKNQTKAMTDNFPDVSFDDIKGNDGVVDEVRTWANLVLASDTSKLGGKIPRGILLKGPPGTGKTSLAKAIANRLQCPFISRSGSDFVEIWVGQGAKRVREMFKEARELAEQYGRCVIFLDEVDALGKARSNGPSHGGNDEREQTLNALLKEMDGFGGENKNVIVVAATNRDELLDEAFLRPGRLDRHYYVGLPMTPEDREEILKVHTKNLPLAEDVDTHALAIAMGSGKSGADIANIANEATLAATCKQQNMVTQADFMEAIQKITVGLARKGVTFTEDDKHQIALHEGLGHAIMAIVNKLPVEMVSVVPRDLSRGGTALGLVKLSSAVENSYLKTRDFVTQMAYMILGGRGAEEVALGKGKISSGASDDLTRVNDMLRQAIEQEGLFYDLSGLVTITPNEKAPEAVKAETVAIRKQLLSTMYQNTMATIAAIPPKAKNFIMEQLMSRETVSGKEVADVYFSPVVMDALKEAGYADWPDLFKQILQRQEKKAAAPKQGGKQDSIFPLSMGF